MTTDTTLNPPQKDKVTTTTPAVVGMWSTFKSELAGPYFPEWTTKAASVTDRDDGPTNVDSNDIEKDNMNAQITNTAEGETTMIQNLYSFPSGWRIVLFKLVFVGLAITTYATQFTTFSHPYFTMAFLTTWSLLATCIYAILSFVASLSSTYYSYVYSSKATATTNTSSLQQQPSLPPKLYNFFFKSIAIFFPIVAVQELIVVFFWIDPMYEEGQQGPTFASAMAHGPLVPLILMDGFLINRIRVRPRQIVFVWVFQCAFLFWTVLYSAFDIMNPHNMNMNMDEAIYVGYLNWRLYPGMTLLTACVIVLLVTPIYFGFVWMLSYYNAKRFWSSRRHQNQRDGGEDSTTTIKQSSMKSLHSTTSKTTTNHSTSNKSLLSAVNIGDGSTALVGEEEQQQQVDNGKDVLGLSSSSNNNNNIRGVRARRRSTQSRITVLDGGEEIVTEITV